MRIKYKILNWGKFNPASEKKLHWCRLDPSILDNEELMECSYNARWLFIAMLCKAINGKGEANMSSSWIYKHTKMRQHQFIKHLSAWQDAGMIEFSVLEEVKKNALQTDRQTDVTDRQTDIASDKKNRPVKVSPDGSASPKASHIDYQAFFNLWNSKSGSLPKLDSLSEGRKRKLKARLVEFPDLSYWEKCIVRMANSRLCVEGGWATFDWLFKNDENHRKVSEGNYDNRDLIQFRKPHENPDLLARLQKIADEG